MADIVFNRVHRSSTCASRLVVLRPAFLAAPPLHTTAIAING